MKIEYMTFGGISIVGETKFEKTFLQSCSKRKVLKTTFVPIVGGGVSIKIDLKDKTKNNNNYIKT